MVSVTTLKQKDYTQRKVMNEIPFFLGLVPKFESEGWNGRARIERGYSPQET